MAELSLYVTPEGNDAWSGRLAAPSADGRDGPFATLAKARDAVRALVADGLTQPVTVYIQSGVYHQPETLVLDESLSGTETCPVTFAAVEGAQPVISGGVPITGWRHESGNLWTADTGEPGQMYRTFRVGATRAIRARYPSYDHDDPIKGGWLFADWWGEPWELGRFDIPIDTAVKPGDWASWQIDVPKADEYAIWLRYVKTDEDPTPVQSTFTVKDGDSVQLDDIGVSGPWHEFRYVRFGTIALAAGEQTITWENVSGGVIALDAIVLCSDAGWNPSENIAVPGWHTREYEVTPPPEGEHFLLIQSEAWSALGEGVEAPRPPDRRFPGSEPPGLRDRFYTRSGDLPDWNDWTDAEIDIFAAWGWSNRILPIDRVDQAEGAVYADYQNDIRPGNRYYITGTRSALTDPGEWHLDRKTGTLSYLVPDDVDGVHGAVLARLKTVIRVTGDHIHLRGITIADTDYTVSGTESAEDGAIEFSGAAYGSVTDCRFQCVSGWGIRLINRSHHINIERNELKYLGQGGIELFGDNDTQPYENAILNNDISDCGHVYAHVAGVYGNASSRNLIAHNRIHRMPRYGISLKSPGNKDAHDNIIEYNDIRDTNLATSDTGAIEVYGSGKQLTGNILRYNRIVNSIGLKMSHTGEFMTPFYSWGIYLDDWASGVTVYGNLIVGNVGGGLNMHGGWDNIIENNIMVNGMDRQLSLSPIFSDINSATLRDNVIRRNVIAFTNPDALFIWCRANRWYPEILKECDQNIYWCLGGVDLESPDLTYLMPTGDLASWRAAGFDRNTRIADPRFTNPENGDYTLRGDSPAFEMGFERIPVEKIG